MTPSIVGRCPTRRQGRDRLVPRGLAISLRCGAAFGGCASARSDRQAAARAMMGSSAANSTLVEQSGQSTDVAARLSIVTSSSQRTHSRVIMAQAWGPVVTASVSQHRGRFTVADVDAVVGINRRRYATNGIKDE